MTYIPMPTEEDGGQKRVWNKEDDVEELLRQILCELRVINVHLGAMTDEVVTEGDVKC